jgi:hypothetical protein
MDRLLKNFTILRSYIRNFLRLIPERPCGWLFYSRYERNLGNYKISQNGLYFITQFNNFWLNYFFLESQKFFLDKQKFFFTVFKKNKSNIKSWFLLLTNKKKINWKKKIILSALYFFPDVNFLWTIGGIIFGIEFLNKPLFKIWKKSKFIQKFCPFFSYKNGKVIILKKIIPHIIFSHIFNKKKFFFSKLKSKFIRDPDEILPLINEKIFKKNKSYLFKENLFFNLQTSKNRKYVHEQDIFLEIFFYKKEKNFEFKNNNFSNFENLLKISKKGFQFLVYLNSKSCFFFHYFISINLFINKNFLLYYLNLKNDKKKVKNNFIKNNLIKKKKKIFFGKFYNLGFFEKNKEKIDREQFSHLIFSKGKKLGF